MRSPLSLFLLIVIFSSGAIIVNCDDSADNNNKNEWDSIFFWLIPELTPTRERQVTQTDTMADDTENHSEDEPFPALPTGDFDSPLPLYLDFSKTGATALRSSSAGASSGGAKASSRAGASSANAHTSSNEPKRTKINPQEDVNVPKTENTTPDSAVSSDCAGKEPEVDDFMFDYDMLARLLAVLKSCDDSEPEIPSEKEKEPAAHPNIQAAENYHRYSISGDDFEKPPSREDSVIDDAEIAIDSSNGLPEKKTPKSDSEIVAVESGQIGFVPLKETTTFAESVAKYEVNGDPAPRKELDIGDELPVKETAVAENKQHDATDDNEDAKKDNRMKRFTFLNFLKQFALLAN